MKYILVLLGVISLIVGIAGIFLPLLPTAPFLILTATLFAKSSTRLHNWLLHHRFLGMTVRNYLEDKTISMKVKVVSLFFLWTSILFSVFFVVHQWWWAQLTLVTTAVLASIHILKMKTKRHS